MIGSLIRYVETAPLIELLVVPTVKPLPLPPTPPWPPAPPYRAVVVTSIERDDGLAAGFTLLAVGAWMALITWTFVRVFHKRLLFLIFANNDVRTNDASHATKDAEVSLSKTATVTTTTQTATETTTQTATETTIQIA